MNHQLIKAQQAGRNTQYSLVDIAQYRPLVEQIAKEPKFIQVYARRLKTAREAREATQEELAHLIGQTHSEIYKIEKAIYKKINVEYFLLFCQYLGVSPEYLLGFESVPFASGQLRNPHFEDGNRPIPLENYLKEWEQQEEQECDPTQTDETAKDVSTLPIDPMVFFDPEFAKKVSFIISNLWKYPEILYKLFQGSKSTNVETCMVVLRCIKFVKRAETPSSEFWESYRTGKEISKENISEIKALYTRMSKEEIPKVYAGTTFNKELLPSDSDTKEVIQLKLALIVLQLESAFEDAFYTVAMSNPDALEEFVKIAFLDETEKRRLNNIIEDVEFAWF